MAVNLVEILYILDIDEDEFTSSDANEDSSNMHNEVDTSSFTAEHGFEFGLSAQGHITVKNWIENFSTSEALVSKYSEMCCSCQHLFVGQVSPSNAARYLLRVIKVILSDVLKLPTNS